ncbi:glycosyltransferase [Paenibacillus hemerocallicola]|uniref:Glycosyltransferase n=1 Tax=Paenibacillus hemerocallicola TaxID=1172614 RepID=A0A5C4T3X6_9BACL|nr:glycosyltransferase [Paenibacillus hemerocallicola]TNJ62997.1 glycosyltransferase [Paenibacillus hemerocallicola]
METKESAKVAIIVLAQHEPLLQPCLSSIILSTGGDYELIVVNDGDHPGIRAWLLQDSKTKLISSPERIGVAAGFNRGAASADADLLVFVRDHVVVTEGWLDRLRDCMNAHEDAALVGPLSNGVSGPQRLELPGNDRRAAIGLADLRAGQSKKVPKLLSHLLVVRKEAFDRLGGFDERFGLETYEDDDLSYRALSEGYGLYIAEDCYVHYSAPPALFPEDPDWYGTQLANNRSVFMDKWGIDAAEALYGWKKRVSVSLCMIVKNEENTLDRCLSGVSRLVDEIVIVDTGSTDRTKEIAGKYTERVYDFEWADDFAAARNYAFSLASKEFICWLDADDILLPEDGERFAQLVGALPWDADAVSMVYNLSFDEQGNVSTSLRRNRLVKRSNNFRWIGAVHEYLEVFGKVVDADIAVTHDRKHANSSRNLNIYEKRESMGERFTSRNLYYYANELADHGLWERAIEKYEMFLGRGDGWIEDILAACTRLSECWYRLNRTDEAKRQALRAFSYALPRAEHCCRLGFYFMAEHHYEAAAYWYDQATKLVRPESSMGMLQLDCWTWLPHLQLCVCYDRMGKRELAIRHNELAASYAPDHPSVLANAAYFAGLQVLA